MAYFARNFFNKFKETNFQYSATRKEKNIVLEVQGFIHTSDMSSQYPYIKILTHHSTGEALTIYN